MSWLDVAATAARTLNAAHPNNNPGGGPASQIRRAGDEHCGQMCTCGDPLAWTCPAFGHEPAAVQEQDIDVPVGVGKGMSR